MSIVFCLYDMFHETQCLIIKRDLKKYTYMLSPGRLMVKAPVLVIACHNPLLSLSILSRKQKKKENK